jgi:hypothetical protein
MNGAGRTENEEDIMFSDPINQERQSTDKTSCSRCVVGALLALAFVFLPAVDVLATGLFFYAHEDGSVRSINMATGEDPGITVPASAFSGTPPSPATSRNIAYDPTTDLLWYSASDNNVHSVNVTTLAAGTTIDDINDAIYGAIRTIAVDPSARRLYVSNSSGAVDVYSLITITKMYSIPVSAFGYSEPNPGNRRHLAADGDSLLWYAAADGTFKQFDTTQYNPHYTGREIPVSEQIGVNPGSERSFVIARFESGDHYLFYAIWDGTVRVADVETLTNVDTFFPASWFDGVTNPGELRSLAIDPTWTAPGQPPATPTGLTASDGVFTDRVLVSWNGVSNVDSYCVWRWHDGAPAWSLLGCPIDVTWFEDLTPVPGVMYDYFVQASNQWGYSDYSNIDSGFAALLPPPSWINATQGDFDDRVRITWGPVTGATSYELSIIPTEGGQVPYSVVVAGTSFDDFGALPEGSVWQYLVSACPDSMQCSGDAGPAWGWIDNPIFKDGFESGDLSQWSEVRQ